MYYLIGHSNLPAENLIQALEFNSIDYLFDVRSRPYSRYCPQFNQPTLRRTLEEETHIGYAYQGNVLGGDMVTCDLSVMCSRLDTLVARNVTDKNVAFMCSERDHMKCHRHWWLGRYLVTKVDEVYAINGVAINSRETITTASYKDIATDKVGSKYTGKYDILNF